MNCQERMDAVLNRCDVLYKNQLISREHLIRVFWRYLNDNLVKEEDHTVSLVMHTGSICFDIISLVFSAVCSLAMDDGEVESVVASLEKGDMVLYKNQKYVFNGIEERQYGNRPAIEYVMLQGKDTAMVPANLWYRIKPYLGESTTLDGRGIRGKNNKRNEFMASLFGLRQEEIPGIIETSIVVIMPRNRASDIVNNTILLDNTDGKIYNLLDIVTASYFTEGNEYYYSGNPGKNEPNLKITSKLSTARELVYQSENQSVKGLFILDGEGVNQSRSELYELMDIRSLRFANASYQINSEFADELADEYDDAPAFICTKEFLLNHACPMDVPGFCTAELDRQIDIILDKDIIPTTVTSICTSDEYKSVRRGLLSIKRTEIIQEHKEDFVIQAMSLLNLLISAPFSMSQLESIMPSELGVLSANKKIELLNDYANAFGGVLRDKAVAITDIIKRLYSAMYDESPKERALKEILSKNRGEKTAIIIPKAYFETILRTTLRHYLGTGRISFYTANRFDNTQLFDRVIVLGDYEGKRFSAFKCNSGRVIDVLLYEFEYPTFNYKRRASVLRENEYNKRINVIPEDGFEPEEFVDDKEAEELNASIIEIDEFLESMNTLAVKNYVTAGAKEGTAMIDAVRMGRFVDGESVLFSKNYKAIVFKEEQGEVAETAIEDLDAGDVLVFTKNDNVTKGIVDEILEQLLDEELLGPSIKESYEQSVYWKQVLRDYMSKEQITYEELANRLASQGCKKNYATIRNWIQPFSHIVGPKDEESYYQIAAVTQDPKLLEAPQTYCEACSIIRRERVRILKLIAAAIVKKLGGKEDTEDELLKAVYENIDNISVRKQLDSVTDIADEYPVPIGMINKPITV